MVREAQEELGITPTNFEQVATIEFYFLSQPEWNMRCHAFRVDSWLGQPEATDEMADPTWFAFSKLPWNKMWTDDQFWLPPILEGKKVNASFLLDSNNQPIGQQVELI